MNNKPVSQEQFEIRVVPNPNPDKKGVIIEIDGEVQEADGFEFAAPLGTGLAVKRITRVELVPAPARLKDW